MQTLCQNEKCNEYQKAKHILKEYMENERKNANIIGNTHGAQPEARRENREVNGNSIRVKLRTLQINGKTVINDLAEA